MNTVDKLLFLPDTLALPDLRRMPIEKVGMRGARDPMRVEDAAGEAQNVLATLDPSAFADIEGFGSARATVGS